MDIKISIIEIVKNNNEYKFILQRYISKNNFSQYSNFSVFKILSFDKINQGRLYFHALKRDTSKFYQIRTYETSEMERAKIIMEYKSKWIYLH